MFVVRRMESESLALDVWCFQRYFALQKNLSIIILVIFDDNIAMMLIYYYSIVLALAISSSAESSIRGIGGDKLFDFSGDCTDDDYANTPYYVSPSGNNWSKDNGWGLSPNKPFKSIQFAVNNKAKCQTIYVMEGTYRNNNYGNSKNNNAKIVTLNNVSNR